MEMEAPFDGLLVPYNTVLLFRENVSQETVHVTMPKGDMGYDQYTFPYTIAVETAFFLLSFSTRKHTTMACRTILMKFL